jgi:hypothetical protein
MMKEDDVLAAIERVSTASALAPKAGTANDRTTRKGQ